MTIIYFDRTGPLIKHDFDCLYIEDLNPEQKMRWRMSRWEMVKAGLKFIWAGVKP